MKIVIKHDETVHVSVALEAVKTVMQGAQKQETYPLVSNVTFGEDIKVVTVYRRTKQNNHEFTVAVVAEHPTQEKPDASE